MEEETDKHAQVPYEDHIIPSTEGGAQELSGFFDMAAEIAKDAVGLAKKIGSDIAELGHELSEMAGADVTGDESFQNQEWADKEWAVMMDRRAMMQEQERDFGR
jgi:hypothetical protein